MLQYIEFQGDKFILVDGEAIATEDQWKRGMCSYAHLYEDGAIKRHGEVIGTKEDIKILGPANVEMDIYESIENMFFGYGWPWDGLIS